MDDNNQKKPLDERIEDTLDEALYRVQNAIYGEKKGSDDVPYTMEDASGFRRPISFATNSHQKPKRTSPLMETFCAFRRSSSRKVLLSFAYLRQNSLKIFSS